MTFQILLIEAGAPLLYSPTLDRVFHQRSHAHIPASNHFLPSSTQSPRTTVHLPLRDSLCGLHIRLETKGGKRAMKGEEATKQRPTPPPMNASRACSAHFTFCRAFLRSVPDRTTQKTRKSPKSDTGTKYSDNIRVPKLAALLSFSSFRGKLVCPQILYDSAMPQPALSLHVDCRSANHKIVARKVGPL